jgi:hypothetical protein
VLDDSWILVNGTQWNTILNTMELDSLTESEGAGHDAIEHPTLMKPFSKSVWMTPAAWPKMWNSMENPTSIQILGWFCEQ